MSGGMEEATRIRELEERPIREANARNKRIEIDLQIAAKLREVFSLVGQYKEVE